MRKWKCVNYFIVCNLQPVATCYVAPNNKLQEAWSFASLMHSRRGLQRKSNNQLIRCSCIQLSSVFSVLLFKSHIWIQTGSIQYSKYISWKQKRFEWLYRLTLYIGDLSTKNFKNWLPLDNLSYNVELPLILKFSLSWVHCRNIWEYSVVIKWPNWH